MSATIRKKSVGHGENGQNRFKTFKTFVESKILSRSDLSKSEKSLEDAENDNENVNSPRPQVNGKPVSASVLTARDNFKRRSSRTSFCEIDLVKFFTTVILTLQFHILDEIFK